MLLQGLLPIDRGRVRVDVVAGVTLAALAIPEVMGYTKIAGMPVITGLYTILVPLVAFALLGSSRHLVVGADSATAAILAAGLAGMATKASSQYVALAGMVALLAAGMLVLARLARLGFLADFLSRTVLIGFLTGVGVQVACGQLAGMLGVQGGGSNPAAQVVNTIKDLGDVSADTVAVSASVLLLIVVGGRLAPKAPWALLAVVGAIVASKALDLSAHGVATLGPVPSGLPGAGIPDVKLSEIPPLLGTAASIFVVILAQSAATSRAYAQKFRDRFDENADLIGLGLANATAGVTGTFVVNGSPTKTAMVDSAGGRSQVAQLTTAAMVAIVLLFLTKPLSYMPSAVLSSVVFLIAVRLVDVAGMRKILRRRPIEFVVAAITAVVVVFIGVEEGIILAIVLSVIVHLRHSYHPHDRLFTVDPDNGAPRAAELSSGVQPVPGLTIFHFGASLYYANADRFQREVLALAEGDGRRVEWLCLECGSIGDVDFSASATLHAVHDDLAERGVQLVVCDLTPEVRAELDRDGLTELIGGEHVFGWPDEVVAAFRARAAVPA